MDPEGGDLPAVGRWKCPGCGEVILPEYSQCWNCGAVRFVGEDGVPAVAPETAFSPPEQAPRAPEDAPREAEAGMETGLPLSRSTLWMEVAAVVLLAVFPFLSWAIWHFLQDTPPPGFAVHVTDLLVWSIAISAPVLYIMSRSGKPWSYFGIARPLIVQDLLLGFVVFAIDFGIYALFTGEVLHHLFPHECYKFPRPSGAAEGFLFVAAIGAGAFSEELVMRGYLIPRLETLLGSTGRSVLASSVLFASYHIYQGWAHTLSILVFGLIYGSAFAITRRLWPVAVAHATCNALFLW